MDITFICFVIPTPKPDLVLKHADGMNMNMSMSMIVRLIISTNVIWVLFQALHEWAETIVKYAAEKPGNFIILVLLITAPFFALSAYLSLKLAKGIEEQKKKIKTIKKIKTKSKKDKWILLANQAYQ